MCKNTCTMYISFSMCCLYLIAIAIMFYNTTNVVRTVLCTFPAHCSYISWFAPVSACSINIGTTCFIETITACTVAFNTICPWVTSWNNNQKWFRMYKSWRKLYLVSKSHKILFLIKLYIHSSIGRSVCQRI